MKLSDVWIKKASDIDLISFIGLKILNDFVSTKIKFFLFWKIFFASLLIFFATTISTKVLVISLANLLLIFPFTIIIPPKALTGSHLKAFLYASNKLLFLQTPQGFACFIITTHGLLISSASKQPACISFMLL